MKALTRQRTRAFINRKGIAMNDQRNMDQQMEGECGKSAMIKKIGNMTYKVLRPTSAAPDRKLWAIKSND